MAQIIPVRVTLPRLVLYSLTSSLQDLQMKSQIKVAHSDTTFDTSLIESWGARRKCIGAAAACHIASDIASNAPITAPGCQDVPQTIRLCYCVRAVQSVCALQT